MPGVALSTASVAAHGSWVLTHRVRAGPQTPDLMLPRVLLVSLESQVAAPVFPENDVCSGLCSFGLGQVSWWPRLPGSLLRGSVGTPSCDPIEPLQAVSMWTECLWD